MKLPKRRRRVVAVEAPRRVRRTGPGQGSVSGGPGRNGDGKCFLPFNKQRNVGSIIRLEYNLFYGNNYLWF